MFRQLVLLLLISPSLAFGSDFGRADLIGDWEWLGNSMERSQDLSGLLRTGPSIKRFLRDGTYHYIEVTDGKQMNPVVGSWEFGNSVITIERPDNGVFKYKIISWKGGVLETQDDMLEAYQYIKRLQ